MENLTPHHSHKTQLKDRTLWFDGDSSFDPQQLLRALQKYNVRYVDYINEAVQEINKHSSKQQELSIKQNVRPMSLQWTLPEEYATLDVREYVLTKLIESLPDNELDKDLAKRCLRVHNELKQYETRGLFDVLRTMIFVINTLTASRAVWGVGRGSSVSSYVLYLIGVHDVDSYAYNLDIEDFLHD